MLSVLALVLGLVGMSLFSIPLGIAALVQIRRRRESGKGMAITGILTGVAWLAASIALVAAFVHFGAVSSFARAVMPKPGECFDSGEEGTMLQPCDTPHDAEMVFSLQLPKQEWPGDQEAEQLATEACTQRVTARYKTRVPIEGGALYVLPPLKQTWSLGDRTIFCAISATDGSKLTKPIGPPPSRLRMLDELQPGDCFTNPRKGWGTVGLIECDKPHDGQITHRFKPASGPDDEDTRSLRGCSLRWKKMFSEHPPPVRLLQSYWGPSTTSQEDGEPVVQCYVTRSDGRPLTRSVVPR